MSWFEINSYDYDNHSISHYKNSNFYEKTRLINGWDAISLVYQDKNLKKKTFIKLYYKNFGFVEKYDEGKIHFK